MRRHRLFLPPVIVLTAAILMLSAPAAAPATSLSISITEGPAKISSSASAKFAFASRGSTSVVCTVDGSHRAPCGSPVSYSGLAAGTHTFAVKAYRQRSFRAASYSWRISKKRSASGSASKTNGSSSTTAPTTSSSPTNTVAKATSTSPQPLGVPGSWNMTFDDEFDGSSLNLSKWQPNWLGPDNTSITKPDNGQDLNCMAPSQVSESGGVLHLSAVARSCTANNGTTYQYASGLVNTYKSFNFSYGYMEARIYIPATSTGAAANFPAFWADGKGTWPTTGELDVMEVLGSCGLSWHFHSTVGAFGGCTRMTPSTGWHTVGANWQAGSVTYYYDGRQVGRLTTGITSSPMYLILNNSVDPTWGGPTVTPADVQVDYVRVWR